MDEYIPLLLSTRLLSGLDVPGLQQLLRCFAPAKRSFARGEILLLAGYENREIGILLEGQIEAVKTTADGTSVSITHMGPGGIFGDVLSGSSTPSPVTVTAAATCTILALPYERLMLPGCSDTAHCVLLRNLVEAISDKYFSLCRRVDLLILKSLRAKLCAWLLEQHHRAGCAMFSTPLTRAQLAEYLNCERSALSRELSRMQAEGLLETHRGSFKLLNLAAIQMQYEGESVS